MFSSILFEYMKISSIKLYIYFLIKENKIRFISLCKETGTPVKSKGITLN